MNRQLPSTIGLIAGNGRFPLLFAEAARRQGVRVVAAASWGDASFLIHACADEVRWFRPGEMKRFFAFFRERGIRHVIMAGQITPDTLFNDARPVDEEYRALFAALADRRCDTIFGAIADRLKAEGMELLDSTLLLKNFLAPRGTLTRKAPAEEQLKDIDFGIVLARQMGGQDIGQTVVVKGRAIVAIEAMEGTDQCILRGGRIARHGAVVVKMAKPLQDDRFDVPVVGSRTIEYMRRARAACLCIEAGRTIIIDRERLISLADRAGISVCAT